MYTQGLLAALEFKNIWITWEQYPAAAIDCKIVGWHGSILENKEQITLIMDSILQSLCLASHSDSYKRTEYVVGAGQYKFNKNLTTWCKSEFLLSFCHTLDLYPGTGYMPGIYIIQRRELCMYSYSNFTGKLNSLPVIQMLYKVLPFSLGYLFAAGTVEDQFHHLSLVVAIWWRCSSWQITALHLRASQLIISPWMHPKVICQSVHYAN